VTGLRDFTLPFFSYGLFQPGELGFLGLRDHVADCRSAVIAGELLIRDGMPILKVDKGGRRTVPGFLLEFKAGAGPAAYRQIDSLEPQKHYCWSETRLDKQRVNVLYGRSPGKGSSKHPDESLWRGKDDPLFTSALQVVQETADQNASFDWDLKAFFRLQMAYMLLWSAIERYVCIRYQMGSKSVRESIMRLSEDAFFRTALLRIVEPSDPPRTVFRADDPVKMEKLDPTDPVRSLDYYYQVRCNITHRGKAFLGDHEMLFRSLSELLPIFQSTKDHAFYESEEFLETVSKR
jgi:hypothetical protein